MTMIEAEIVQPSPRQAYAKAKRRATLEKLNLSKINCNFLPRMTRR